MQIPGHIDPVTTGTVPLRGGNRIDLVGLTRDAIGGVLVEAGLDAKAAKLRAKQIWHWIYHRGVTDFEAMTDIAKTMRPWLTDRFIIGTTPLVDSVMRRFDSASPSPSITILSAPLTSSKL